MKTVIYFDSNVKNFNKFSKYFKQNYFITNCKTYESVLKQINNCDVLIINPKFNDKEYLEFLDNIVNHYDIENIIAITELKSDLLQQELMEHLVFNYTTVTYHKEELTRMLLGKNTTKRYNKICKVIRDSGVNSELKGFYYIADIVNICLDDINKIGSMQNLYALVAANHNTTLSSVERNIRTCVKEYNRLNAAFLTNSSYVTKIINIFL